MPPIEWPTSTTGSCSTVTARTSSRSTTELLDGVRLDRRPTGLAVATLVVEHHPDLVAPLLFEAGALEVVCAHGHTETVREHDRQRSVGWTHLPDRERHTVGGGHHAGTVEIEEREILCGMGVVGSIALAHRTGGGQTADRRQSGDTGHPVVSHGHDACPCHPKYTRGGPCLNSKSPLRPSDLRLTSTSGAASRGPRSPAAARWCSIASAKRTRSM